MRLICGFLHLDGQAAERARLVAMISAMIEPGLSPVVTSYVEGPVALAMLDFAATGRAGEPPSVLPRSEGGLVLAADCRLYDGAQGKTDDVALFDALEERGGDGLGRLSGDFAIAAWNSHDQTLLCARDGAGIRPFFTDDQPGRVFAFASLPRGLHASGFIERELDPASLLSTLLMRATPNDRTIFRGVGRLAPGSWRRVSAHHRESGWHWRLDPAIAGRNKCRPEEAAEEMTALVSRAVRRRLPDSGPVASHLSGGLDSPSVCVLAARAMREAGRPPVLAYSFVPTPHGGYAPDGEGPLVQAVLDQEADIVGIPVRIGPSREFLLPRMDCDQPMPFDPADPDAWICMDAAARGARVLLSGWGGDEGASFNGRGALAEALLAGRWLRLAREIRAVATNGNGSILAALRSQVLGYIVPDSVWSVAQRLRGGGAMGTAERLSPFLRREAMDGVTPPPPPMRPDAVANHVRLLNGPVLKRRPEYWALTCARTGIAAAFPLLDRSVIEFAASLPGELFIRGGVARRLYRDAMVGILPDKILRNRTKAAPFAETSLIVALQRDALLALLPDLRQHPQVDALFDLDALEQRLRAFPAPEEALRRAGEIGDNPALAELAALLPRLLRFVAYVRQHH